MMQRDKENREFRKLNRGRIKEHPKYLSRKRERCGFIEDVC